MKHHAEVFRMLDESHVPGEAAPNVEGQRRRVQRRVRRARRREHHANGLAILYCSRFRREVQ